MKQRLFIVLLLGFSSGLPLSLITGTLQAWYASSGMSVLATGALSLIGLPYAYRVFIGPVVDRYALFAMGKRRSWILSTQVLLLLAFLAMSFLSPQHNPGLLAAVAFLVACLSATQDLAIEAHRVEFLPTSEHGIGASIASFAYRIAMLVSGGLALIMAEAMGWVFTYRCMALGMLVGIFAIVFSKEPTSEIQQHDSLRRAYLEPFKEFFSRPGVLYLLAFVLLFKSGEVFTTTISGIVMPFLIQGLGFSLSTIGYVNKIVAVFAIVLGGLLAGLVLLRYSLFRALLVFGVFQALTNLLFVALAMVGKNTSLLVVAVFSDNFAAGLGATALVALFMRLTDKRFTGTQFSLLVAFSSLPRIVSGPLAALIQMHLGWVGLYQLSVFIALLFIPFLYKIKALIGAAQAPVCLNMEEQSA